MNVAVFYFFCNQIMLSMDRKIRHCRHHEQQTPQNIGSDLCRRDGGKMMLRVPPEAHGAALVAAKADGMSLNQWAARYCKTRLRSEQR